MSGDLYFTVDLDRDANEPVWGSVAAGSIDRGEGGSPRFSSAERGLGILLDVLDDVGMRATFFVEGRTAETIDCSGISGHAVGFHGYDHEDLSGGSTGVVIDDEGVRCILEKGFHAVSDMVARPTCFRAPYMAGGSRALKVLPSLGIRADSSVYTDGPCHPYKMGGIAEYPVPRSRDRRGRPIAAYLWPMHEGRRSPSDYVDMAVGRGCFTLATHTWHMCESRSGGVMDPERERSNAEDVREVLSRLLDSGFRPRTIRSRAFWL